MEPKVMDKAVEKHLLSFCAAQQADFNPNAWLALMAQRPQEALCAVRMLSKARWYGRLRELRALMQNSLMAEPAPAHAAQLAQQCGFDRARFGERLREQMWFRQEPKR
jgi:hypothetical protein